MNDTIRWAIRAMENAQKALELHRQMNGCAQWGSTHDRRVALGNLAYYSERCTLLVNIHHNA